MAQAQAPSILGGTPLEVGEDVLLAASMLMLFKNAGKQDLEGEGEQKVDDDGGDADGVGVKKAKRRCEGSDGAASKRLVRVSKRRGKAGATKKRAPDFNLKEGSEQLYNFLLVHGKADTREVAKRLKINRRRVSDMANVLVGFHVIFKHGRFGIELNPNFKV